jgi:hypothetical protein
MLRHFEAFITSFKSAFETSNGQMTFQMLSMLRLLNEQFFAIYDRAFNWLATRHLNNNIYFEIGR